MAEEVRIDFDMEMGDIQNVAENICRQMEDKTGYSDYITHTSFRSRSESDKILNYVAFSMEQFMGNCSTVIASSISQCNYDMDRIVELIEQIAYFFNYSCIMYSTVADQESLNKVLESRGWKPQPTTIRNKRSGNVTTFWIKEI